MNKTLFLQTPKENIISYMTFYNKGEDNETLRNDATVALLVTADFNENGELIRPDISFTESPLSQFPENLQVILKEKFEGLSDDSVFVMRFFEKVGEEQFAPIYLQDKEELKDLL